MYETFSYLKEFFQKIFEFFYSLHLTWLSYVEFTTFVSMRKRKVIVSVSSDLVTDNRVHRTCTVLHEMGFEILLIGRKKKLSPSMNERAYRYKRLHLFFEKGPFFYAEMNLRLFFLLLFRRKDLLYSNDLDTLLPNFIVSKITRTPIIYDSHELFTEAPELIHRKKVRGIWLAIEKRIFPSLKYMITVNQSIAQTYQDLYGKPLVVVRNIPSRFQGDSLVTREALNLPLPDFLVIIQGSGLNIDRGIEEAVLAMIELTGVTLLLVGDGDVMPKVKTLIKDHGLEHKVRIFGRRPYLELMQFTQLSDLGLTLDKPLSKNYEFSLPNKVFDYMHAGIPILASKLVEIESLIQTFQIGTILPEVSPTAIAKAIQTLRDHPTLLQQQREACLIAAQTENWENEQQKLIALVEAAIGNQSL